MSTKFRYQTNRRSAFALLPRSIDGLVLFLAGILLRIDVHFIGRLSLAEVFLACLAPLYFLARKPISSPLSKKFYFGISIFLISVISSDLWNATEFGLMIRGTARPIIILLMFVTLFRVLSRDVNLARFFFIGLLFSALINVVYKTDSRAEMLADFDELTYAYRAFVYTPIVYAISSIGAWLISRHSKPAAALFLITIGTLVSVDFSRTTSMVLIFSGLIMLFSTQIESFLRSTVSRRASFTTVLFLVAPIALMATYFLLRIYIELAASGLAGERIAEKVSDQIVRPTSDEVVNLFLNGRHYNISNVLMILDHPLFGTGSWPLEGPYVLRAMDWLGASPSTYYLDKMMDSRGIGHSILLGSWANYGLQGAIFWFMSLGWTFKYGLHLFRKREPILWLVLPYLVLFVFSIWFNNLNSLNRVLAAMVPAALAVLLAAPKRGGRRVVSKRNTARPASPRSL